MEMKIVNDHFMQPQRSTYIAEQELQRQESGTSLSFASVNAILDLSNAFSKQKWFRDVSSGEEPELQDLPHLPYRTCTEKSAPSNYSKFKKKSNESSTKEVDVENSVNAKRRGGSVQALINILKVDCISPMRIQSDRVFYGGNPLRHKRRGCIVQAMIKSDSWLDLTSSKRRKK